MPIYEYQCQSCQHELEALQKISEDPLRDCPQCGEPKLRKRVSAVAFRLKGGGWYETDFKTGDKKNLAGEAGQKSKDTAAASGSADKSASQDSKTSAPSAGDSKAGSGTAGASNTTG